MKDLDFDELDRAVASALGGSQTVSESSADTPPQSNSVSTVETTPVPPQASPATSSISAHGLHARIMPSSTQPSRSALSRKSVMSDTASVDETTATPIAPSESTAPQAEADKNNPPKRTIPHREGRFMDVVRPGAVAQSSMPRPAKTIADTEVSLGEAPSMDTPSEATNSTLESAINELLVSEGHAPVDSSATEPETTLPETAAPSGLNETEDSIDQIAAELGQVEPESPAPSGSPFLADAKVEKRPLGGALGDESAMQPAADVSDLPAVAPEPEAENAPVPEELQNDLTAIETGSVPLATPHEEDSTDLAVDLTSKTEALPETSAPIAGPTSIARQYKEQPRTASEDDESGAIFDPQTYQQPIEHPAKKSSGWGWVIAIIVIVLLAVAAAVGAWFAGLLPVAL